MSKTPGEKLAAAIDKHWADTQDDGFRAHLGASVCGHACARHIWYVFRWAYQKKHLGRILRLFERGKREEAEIAKWLTSVGAEIREFSKRLCYHPESDSYLLVDWDQDYSGDGLVEDVTGDPVHLQRAKIRGVKPEQFRISAYHGHFGGSGDGMIRGLEQFGFPKCWGLLEDKTHGDKSFKNLEKKGGVVSGKPEHFIQMQIYMYHMGLEWGCYFPVNKNDDHTGPELVTCKPEVAKHYTERAGQIICQQSAPPKINESASWWVCKMCDHRHICHEGHELARNCRSCVYAEPVLSSDQGPEGSWRCKLHDGIIPKDFLRKGCDSWEPIA